MNTVSGLMKSGMMTQTLRKGLEILLEARIASERRVKVGDILKYSRDESVGHFTSFSLVKTVGMNAARSRQASAHLPQYGCIKY